ncbi:hypothetical protein ABZP36_012921 [Zizania latifolia]
MLTRKRRCSRMDQTWTIMAASASSSSSSTLPHHDDVYLCSSPFQEQAICEVTRGYKSLEVKSSDRCSNVTSSFKDFVFTISGGGRPGGERSSGSTPGGGRSGAGIEVVDVEKAIKRLPGIHDAAVDVLMDHAQVVFDPTFVSVSIESPYISEHPWLQNARKAPNVLLGDIVKSRLKQLSRINRFRKIALRVIADHLSAEEVEDKGHVQASLHIVLW